MKLFRLRFTVRSMMAGLMIIAFLMWFAQVVQRAQQAGKVHDCQKCLSFVALGLTQYATVSNAFPYAALPNPALQLDRRLSWLVKITPYFDCAGLYNGFHQDEPWDSPSNASMMVDMAILHCPEVRRVAPGAQTNWVGITGVGPDSPRLPTGHRRAGIFGFDRVTRLSDIKDGAATTSMVAETGGATGYWTQAGDATVRAVDPAHRPYIGRGRPFGGLHPGGVNAVFADGSVRFLSETMDSQVFESLSTVAGRESLPAGWDR